MKVNAFLFDMNHGEYSLLKFFNVFLMTVLLGSFFLSVSTIYQ